MIAFRFRLRPVAGIEPWGEPGKTSLHWFGLSDGWTCIDTPAGRLLETKAPSADPRSPPWCDYQVVRLFKDLLETWPAIAEPVPEDVARTSDGQKALADEASEAGDDGTAEAIAEARSWWRERHVPFGHLSSNPELVLWRTGEQAHLHWSANPRGKPGCADHWSVAAAEHSLPFADLHAAVRDFAFGFLAAMAERVARIVEEGWRRDCALDVDRLVADQSEWEIWAERMLAREADTDWSGIRDAHARLGR